MKEGLSIGTHEKTTLEMSFSLDSNHTNKMIHRMWCIAFGWITQESRRNKTKTCIGEKCKTHSHITVAVKRIKDIIYKCKIQTNCYFYICNPEYMCPADTWKYLIELLLHGVCSNSAVWICYCTKHTISTTNDNLLFYSIFNHIFSNSLFNQNTG